MDIPIHEQHAQFNSRLQIFQSKIPLKEKVFYTHGELVATAITFGTGLVFWRCAFRAFNLHKFDKSRIPSLIITLTTCVQGGIIYTLLVKDKFIEAFIPPTRWEYVRNTLISHNLTHAITLPSVVGFLFMNAHKHGMVVIPDKMWSKGYRHVTWNEFTSRLRPFHRRMIIGYVISNVFGTFLGYKAYSQKQNIMAKLFNESQLQ